MKFCLIVASCISTNYKLTSGFEVINEFAVDERGVLLEKFDAIIVGGGAGGCVAARTLFDAGWNVLIIERGDVSGEWSESLNTLKEVLTENDKELQPILTAEGIRSHAASTLGGGTALNLGIWIEETDDYLARLFERITSKQKRFEVDQQQWLNSQENGIRNNKSKMVAYRREEKEFLQKMKESYSWLRNELGVNSYTSYTPYNAILQTAIQSEYSGACENDRFTIWDWTFNSERRTNYREDGRDRSILQNPQCRRGSVEPSESLIVDGAWTSTSVFNQNLSRNLVSSLLNTGEAADKKKPSGLDQTFSEHATPNDRSGYKRHTYNSNRATDTKHRGAKNRERKARGEIKVLLNSTVLSVQTGNGFDEKTGGYNVEGQCVVFRQYQEKDRSLLGGVETRPNERVYDWLAREHRLHFVDTAMTTSLLRKLEFLKQTNQKSVNSYPYRVCLKPNDPEGKIILAAGAINTPLILFNSGIGPKAEIQKLDVPLVLDHPEIGRNLQDRPVLGVTGFLKDQLKEPHVCQSTAIGSTILDSQNTELQDTLRGIRAHKYSQQGLFQRDKNERDVHPSSSLFSYPAGETLPHWHGSKALLPFEELHGGLSAMGVLLSSRVLLPPMMRSTFVGEFVFSFLADCTAKSRNMLAGLPSAQVDRYGIDCKLVASLAPCLDHAVVWWTFLSEVESKGSVTINAQTKLPIIDVQYLSSEKDEITLNLALKKMIKTIKKYSSDLLPHLITHQDDTCPTRIFENDLELLVSFGSMVTGSKETFHINVTSSLPFASFPQRIPDHEDDQAIAKYVQDYYTSMWHFIGTVQVGKALDENFEILNTRRLAVLDAAAMPILTRMNPSATVMALSRVISIQLASELNSILPGDGIGTSDSLMDSIENASTHVCMTFFGGGKKSKRSSIREALAHVFRVEQSNQVDSLDQCRATIADLQQRQTELENQKEAQYNLVQVKLKADDRLGARQALKRLKLYDHEIEQLDLLRLKIETIIFEIESAITQQRAVGALTVLSEKHKKVVHKSNVKRVAKLLEDLTQRQTTQTKLASVIKGDPFTITTTADCEPNPWDQELAEFEFQEFENKLKQLAPLPTSVVKPVEQPKRTVMVQQGLASP